MAKLLNDENLLEDLEEIISNDSKIKDPLDVPIVKKEEKIYDSPSNLDEEEIEIKVEEKNEEVVEALENEEVADVFENVVVNEEVVETKTTTKYSPSVIDSNITLEELCNGLDRYMRNNGLTVDRNSISSFIAGLASRRLIFINHTDSTISEKFIELVSSYFNSNYSIEASSFNETISSVISKFNKENFYFVTLKNYNKESSLSNALAYIKNFKKGNSIGFSFVSSNVYFISSLDNTDLVLNSELNKYSMILFLTARNSEPSNIEGDSKSLTYKNYYDKVFNNLNDKETLDEDEWKKYDEFLESSNTVISDLEFHFIEMFSIAYLLCENNQGKALDSLTSSLIIPYINNIKPFVSTNAVVNLVELAEKSYANSDMTILGLKKYR